MAQRQRAGLRHRRLRHAQRPLVAPPGGEAEHRQRNQQRAPQHGAQPRRQAGFGAGWRRVAEHHRAAEGPAEQAGDQRGNHIDTQQRGQARHGQVGRQPRNRHRRAAQQRAQQPGAAAPGQRGHRHHRKGDDEGQLVAQQRLHHRTQRDAEDRQQRRRHPRTGAAPARLLEPGQHSARHGRPGAGRMRLVDQRPGFRSTAHAGYPSGHRVRRMHAVAASSPRTGAPHVHAQPDRPRRHAAPPPRRLQRRLAPDPDPHAARRLPGLDPNAAATTRR